ncbi:MAG: methyltransferase domain-containing protein [Streptomyces sp.]|uniref:methyltransferase domain-containing protein n=1 Tax=Streptomyces sp. TaxID=1931 RepID=UPI003D6BBFEE
MSAFGGQRWRLAEAMERRGDWPVDSPWVREAVEAVPRHAFAPERLWQWNGQAYVPVDRGVDEEGWAALVYGGPDDAAVTQVSGGAASSSLSCQAVVADMLDSLDAEPGRRILELGTGTGWNAALLARRVGNGRVTSVEVDPLLAEQARARLKAAGVEVAVETGDGGAGWPPGAPYDRVISTYAVDRVPWAWVAQTRPGGRIVTPWGRLGHVALTVADDGRTAGGWMQGLAQFMPARGSRAGTADFAHVRGTGPAANERTFERNPGPLHDDWHLRFALRVALPDVHLSTAVDEDGVNAWLHDGSASWAVLSAHPDGRTVAHQGGPRSLADLLEREWDGWLAAGSPELYDFGMTVEPERQFVWAWDGHNGPRWSA